MTEAISPAAETALPEDTALTEGDLEVVIVGAGAAGIGTAIILQELGIERFAVLERHDVGASFARWPKEMRFITPSFTSNAFGLLDLNAVALNTSPAYTIQREHPTGAEYAEYLQILAGHFELPIRTGVEVRSLEPLPDDEGFILHTSAGDLRSAFVIWAAGEFQYPRLGAFPGAELCRHNAEIGSWKEVTGDEIVVIGGFESGIDAAYHLVMSGKSVRVLDGAASWDNDSSDPSIALSPYTRERLDLAQETGRLELVGETWVAEVARRGDGYVIRDTEGNEWETTQQPILATGFAGSLQLVRDLFDWDEEGRVQLSERDESTRVPGLFVVGPSVRHGKAIFCYIYKFRQRLAVVAEAIGERLGLDLRLLEVYEDNNMLLEDLSCCDAECAC
jgi:putative flavoprotein involved in K+ transport